MNGSRPMEMIQRVRKGVKKNGRIKMVNQEKRMNENSRQEDVLNGRDVSTRKEVDENESR
jgi:hypothetical protein